MTSTSAAGNSDADDPWRFPDGADVTIVCGSLEGVDSGRFADPGEPNYMATRAYADVDALIDLYGHLRAVNPGSRVTRTRVDKTTPTPDQLRGHVILLGNMAWLQLGPDVSPPVRPVRDIHPDGEIFEVGGTRFEPVVHDDGFSDWGLLWRGRNPYDDSATMTICSGVFTRGVVGAVLALIDPAARDGNVAFLNGRLGDAHLPFGMLFHVPVRENVTQTPLFEDQVDVIQELVTSS